MFSPTQRYNYFSLFSSFGLLKYGCFHICFLASPLTLIPELHVRVRIHWTMTAMYQVCQRQQVYSCLRYTRGNLLTLDGQYVCSAQLADRVHQLGIAPGGRHCCRPATKKKTHQKKKTNTSVIMNDTLTDLACSMDF